MNIDEFIEHTKETARKHRYQADFFDIYSKALDDLLNSLPDCDYVGIERLVCLVEQLKRGGENE